MAELLEQLRAAHATRVLSPARPTISVEKLAFFWGPCVRGTFSRTAIKILNRLKFAVVKARVFPHLEA
jgi:hypothetical protein